jgi:methionyl-tRNA formyltransferase
MMQLNQNPRIGLMGSVNSSKKLLEKLIAHNLNVVSVFGLDPKVSTNVSGFQDLKPMAENAGLRFHYFDKISEPWVVEEIKQQEVDILFVVGLSQLVRSELLAAPKHCCIGYHPTLLPQGRGRAAVAWIVMGEVEPAVTLFKIDEGMDTGDIFFQQKVTLPENPYAQDVVDALLEEFDVLLDTFLPQLKNGQIQATPQDHAKATYLEIRRPNDGYIDWEKPAEDIFKLIRAVSQPLPGAFTYFKTNKITIWRAEIDKELPVKGVPGRILRVDGDSFWVQTADHPIKITTYTVEEEFIPKVGIKLGFGVVDFVNFLKNA